VGGRCLEHPFMTNANVVVSPDAATWVATELREQRMSVEVIHALLCTEEPATIRRYLELHSEWLKEQLADQLRRLALVEETLRLWF
jgi:hypothetical protein